MQFQKKTKIVFLSNPWRIFVFEAFLFSLTLGLGIITAFRINKILEVQEVSPPQISFWQFIFYFLFTTLFIFLISYFLKFKKKKALIFKTIFILAVFSGGLLLLSAWLSDIVSLSLITFLIFWWWKKPSIFIQDLLIILGMAGAGSILGLNLNPQVVSVLLIVFSIYDFVAVYKTKHMIRMAKEMIKSEAILGLIVPSELSSFKENLKGVRPGGKFLILGGGDIVFPLVFAVSLIPFGILKSFIVAFFSLIGLFFSFWFFISQKTRQPIPALPPIALFSIIGYLITTTF